MKSAGIITAALMAACLAPLAMAQTVGVSWASLDGDRWAAHEAAIKAAIEEAGGTYAAADAQGSAERQLADIAALIADGAQALILQPQDPGAIAPAILAATEAGVPMLGYGSLVEDPRAFFLALDPVEVGRLQARALRTAVAEGRYVMVKGASGDPASDLMLTGQLEELQEAIDNGKITIGGEVYTEDWLPANAQRNLARILDALDDKVDAIVASDDRTAEGAIAALAERGIDDIPVSGRDGTPGALNRIARGTQAMTVWIDPAEMGTVAGNIAVALAGGTDMSLIEGVTKWVSPGGTEVLGVFLTPQTIKIGDLSPLIEAGHVSQEVVCQGVEADTAPCN